MEILEKIVIPEVYLPILYVCIAFLVYNILTDIFTRGINRKIKVEQVGSGSYKKLLTIRSLARNIIKWIIIAFTILAILTVFGINISTVLAGFGIVGLVVGLALQDLAKDLISGFTIIFENQYAVGDTVTINGFKGEVIYVGLKTTRIKNYDGEIKIIANRNATEVINHSFKDSLAIVYIDVAYEEDNDKVEAILNDELAKLSTDIEDLLEPIRLMGIQDLTASSVRYRIEVRTEPMKHFIIERKIRKALKQRLDKEKIKIPYTQIEVHNGK